MVGLGDSTGGVVSSAVFGCMEGVVPCDVFGSMGWFGAMVWFRGGFGSMGWIVS